MCSTSHPCPRYGRYGPESAAARPPGLPTMPPAVPPSQPMLHIRAMPHPTRAPATPGPQDWRAAQIAAPQVLPAPCSNAGIRRHPAAATPPFHRPNVVGVVPTAPISSGHVRNVCARAAIPANCQRRSSAPHRGLPTHHGRPARPAAGERLLHSARRCPTRPLPAHARLRHATHPDWSAVIRVAPHPAAIGCASLPSATQYDGDFPARAGFVVLDARIRRWSRKGYPAHHAQRRRRHGGVDVALREHSRFRVKERSAPRAQRRVARYHVCNAHGWRWPRAFSATTAGSAKTAAGPAACDTGSRPLPVCSSARAACRVRCGCRLRVTDSRAYQKDAPRFPCAARDISKHRPPLRGKSATLRVWPR